MEVVPCPEQGVVPLVVSSDPHADGALSLTDTLHPRARVLSELADAHGVLGLWPSAYAACEALRLLCCSEDERNECKPPLHLVELGAGAGLPSLYAAVSLRHAFSTVVAADLEELPLRLLEAAHQMHSASSGGAIANLKTRRLDVVECPDSELDGADVVVAADLLYSPEVARALGGLLGRHVASSPCTVNLVVTDPGRQGREVFLTAYKQHAGPAARHARFKDVPVQPQKDVFDGSSVSVVGLLSDY
mgnify:CR=1 FL=1